MWKNPVQNTPSIVQVDFGVYGQNLPGDGEDYCAPTSVLMGLYYLSANGLTQLAPATYGGQEDPAATNLERVIAGLMGTSSTGGTGGWGILNGVTNYLSACGISPDQYIVNNNDMPDFSWIAGGIAPNVSPFPTGHIVLATFAVGWFSRASDTSTDFTNGGGHVLAPLAANPVATPWPAPSGPFDFLVINNAYPASFFKVPNLPSQNPQMVQIVGAPPGWSLPGMGASQNYSQVVTNVLGGENVAILWGATTWTIDAAARPAAPGYQISPWNLTDQVSLDTNGGNLTVIAPVEGSGGFAKVGEGMILLTGANSSTGANAVTGGTLASSQTSGTPFGSGAMSLTGGAVLQLQGAGATSAAIASGDSSTFTAGAGGGTLAIVGSDASSVRIGGNDDGVTPNLVCQTDGTLVIAPGGGIAALGAAQQILVNGTAGNLPAVSSGMVAPCIVGLDNAAQSSGRFLTYDAASGFTAAAVTLSTDVGINQVPSDAIYRVVNDQTIDSGGAPLVTALEVDGVTIFGGDSSALLVGSQAAGASAGVILNDVPNILAGRLQFGAASGLIYASGQSKISSLVCGSAGLTTFGLGTLTLSADNAETLSGSVIVNSGILIAAGSAQGSASATGSGAVMVNSGAMLEVTGGVAGAVTVDTTGVLLMNGGTVAGPVTIVETTSPDPSGILQGGGTITGFATLDGAIQSGPQAGMLTFTGGISTIGGTSTSSGTSFWWRLQSPVDSTNGKPGVDWNAVHIGGAGGSFGTDGAGVTYYLDFSALSCGDPDQGNTFWQSSRLWPLVITSGACYDDQANFTYQAGNFDFRFSGGAFCLTWTPASSPQDPAQQRRTRAAARGRSRQSA